MTTWIFDEVAIQLLLEIMPEELYKKYVCHDSELYQKYGSYIWCEFKKQLNEKVKFGNKEDATSFIKEVFDF